ncbi:hypothetical protein AXG93_4123s1180 [Marchantia polymorpha subsp. ruderalis]|uniref:Uncharacterized protein n=1 Tax=Marchantia polymorpha subsp. ruderalis TaxID=1480154 RepID=A0A176WL40_MARPO|nr:hypothetical protein AXG93_4123s1180 [Marchantia polymorpha subsp. ruderalis]
MYGATVKHNERGSSHSFPHYGVPARPTRRSKKKKKKLYIHEGHRTASPMSQPRRHQGRLAFGKHCEEIIPILLDGVKQPMMDKHRLGPLSLGTVGSRLRVGRQVPIQGRRTGHEIIFVVQAKGCIRDVDIDKRQIAGHKKDGTETQMG